MHWPQIVVIVLITVSVVINLLKHGESSGKFSIWWALIVNAAWIFILHSGGFFG